MNRDEYTKSFESRFNSSIKAVKAVAQWMRNWGDVETDETEWDGTWEADHGDIYFRRVGETLWKRYEVKGRSIRFTSDKDFPFDSMLVCAVQSLERAHQEKNLPHAFFVVSKCLKHVGIIHIETSQHWKQGWQRDNERDYSYLAWYCPLKHIRFMRIHNA